MIRLSALKEDAAVDICVYLFELIRQGLSQAVTEINVASNMEFLVIGQDGFPGALK